MEQDFDEAVLNFKVNLANAINSCGLPLSVIDLCMEESQQEVKYKLRCKKIKKDGEK